MATYVPGTEERDSKKVIMSLQQVGPRLDTAVTNIATNTTDIATNTADIATNTTDIAALQAASYVNTIEGASGALTLNETSGIELSGSAIQLRQGSSTQFGAVKVDGTTITASSGVLSAASSAPTAATQAEQETATSTTTYVSPGRQQYHPSAAKAWCKWGVTTTIDASYNISSITDDGTGDWTLNINTDFSSANYAVSYVAMRPGTTSSVAVPVPVIYSSGQAAGTLRVNSIELQTSAGNGVLVDPTKNYVIMFGDHA